MKKSYNYIIIIILLCSVSSFGQGIEIIPQINYTLGGKIRSQTGELKIENSESYGVAVNLVRGKVAIQLDYFYQPTAGTYREYLETGKSEEVPLQVSWYHIGVRRRFVQNETVVPFAGLSLGITDFDLESSPRYTEQALSIGLQGGANIYPSDRIGLTFHARLLCPIQFNGFGFYAGTGGSGVQATAGSYFVQMDFGTGIIVRLGN